MGAASVLDRAWAHEEYALPGRQRRSASEFGPGEIMSCPRERNGAVRGREELQADEDASATLRAQPGVGAGERCQEVSAGGRLGERSLCPLPCSTRSSPRCEAISETATATTPVRATRERPRATASRRCPEPPTWPKD